MSSPYNIEVIKKLLIFNPTQRGPLTVGEMIIDYHYVVKALQNSGATLHTFEPFEVIDKIGFLKRGDEAAELFLDALAEQVQQDIDAGGVLINLGGVGSTLSTDDDE